VSNNAILLRLDTKASQRTRLAKSVVKTSEAISDSSNVCLEKLFLAVVDLVIKQP
jgi:hypothetical protein